MICEMELDSSGFWPLWRTYYGDTPPLAHLLRERYPKNFVRLHSLPDAQRYPNNSKDWAEVMSRYQSLSAEVLPPSHMSGLVLAKVTSIDASPARNSIGTDGMHHIGRWSECENGEVTSWDFHLKTCPWAFFEFEQIFKQVASGFDGYAIVISYENGDIFAPYDGGADLFIGDERAVFEIGRKYRI